MRFYNKSCLFASYALVGYVAIFLGFTFPLAINFTNSLPGLGGDVLQFVWGFWHMQQSLIQGANPFWAPEIYSPLHVNLMLHTWTPIKALLAQPLLTMFQFNLITTYNLLFLFSYVMTALGGYFFLCTFGVDKRVAFIGGVLISFSPNQMGHGYGHFNLISTEAIPWLLYVWRRKHLNPYISTGFLAGLGAYLFLSDYNLFVFVGLLAVVYLGYQWFNARAVAKADALRMAWAGSVFVLLLLPFIIMAMREFHQYSAMAVHGERWGGAEELGNNFLSFFLPSPLHPWWGKFTQSAAARFSVSYGGVENIGYFGYLASFLCLYGVLKYHANKIVRFWILVGMVFFALSLGPILRIGPGWMNQMDKVWLFSFDTIKVVFPMPYTLIHYLPLINGARVPGRFILITFIAAAVVVSLVLDKILHLNWLESQFKKNTVLSIVLLVVLVEWLPAPYPIVQLNTPEMYTLIHKDEGRKKVVLDLPCPPWAWNDIRPLYYQTYHKHDIVGGWTARESKAQREYFFKYNVIKQVGLCDPTVKPEEFEKALKELNVTYIPVRGKRVIEEVRMLTRSIPRLKVLDENSAEETVLWMYEK